MAVFPVFYDMKPAVIPFRGDCGLHALLIAMRTHFYGCKQHLFRTSWCRTHSSVHRAGRPRIPLAGRLQSQVSQDCSHFVSVHEPQGLVHNGSKAFGLTVFATCKWRKLRHLDAKVFRLLYCWCKIASAQVRL
jgi:hypothetical protein